VALLRAGLERVIQPGLVAQVGSNLGHQQLGLQEGVCDAAGRDGVLVMSGVAD